MFGCFKKLWIFISLITWINSFWSMFCLLILFKAHTNPLFLCWAINTSPNFPAPSFLPKTKSSIFKKGSSIYFCCLTFENEPVVETLSLYYFFFLLKKTISKISLLFEMFCSLESPSGSSLKDSLP